MTHPCHDKPVRPEDVAVGSVLALQVVVHPGQQLRLRVLPGVGMGLGLAQATPFI